MRNVSAARRTRCCPTRGKRIPVRKTDSIPKEAKYKSPKRVIDMLVDIVSQNGNLLLKLPFPNSGYLDSQELRTLSEITAWMAIKRGRDIFVPAAEKLDDLWASLFRASLPPSPGLTASSCSFGRPFATRFFQLHLAGTLCGSLWLPSPASISSFHPIRFCPCRAHSAGGPLGHPTGALRIALDAEPRGRSSLLAKMDFLLEPASHWPAWL